jgi:hypothetical protein
VCVDNPQVDHQLKERAQGDVRHGKGEGKAESWGVAQIDAGFIKTSVPWGWGTSEDYLEDIPYILMIISIRI